MRPGALKVLSAGAGLTIQDAGRPGFQTYGLSRGGAMDPAALAAGAALLGNDAASAALELTAAGARFEVVDAPVAIALTGPPMRAAAAGQDLLWEATHLLEPGTVLDIRPTGAGLYAYLSLPGGVDAPLLAGACSAHLAAGLGASLGQGDVIRAGRASDATSLVLEPALPDRPTPIRVLPSVQDHLFAVSERERFEGTVFRTSARANRMGAALEFGGGPFHTTGHLSITSEVVIPGDIQLVGGGMPYVLFGECQTTGGYPRIATVISADLSRLAQTPPGQDVRFRFVGHEEALAARREAARALAQLPERVRPLRRDPADIADLLAYQLVSGVTAGGEDT